MGSLQGAAWNNQFGAVDGPAFNAWCEFCSDLTRVQFLRGMDRWKHSKGEFLTAKLFRDLCLDKQERTEHDNNWKAYKTFQKQEQLPDLGKRERAKAARNEFIDGIREKVKS